MKNLALLVFLCLPFLLQSQNELEVNFSLSSEAPIQEPSKHEVLMADNVALRSDPSLSGNILTRLTIGTQLLLKEKSPKTMTKNNIKSHWYLVEVNGRSGWIWGGLIAIQSFESDTDSSVKFVLGYEKSTFNAESETFQCEYQIRAVQGSEQLDKIVINATDEIDTFENLGEKGFENIDDILKGRTICGAYDCLMQITYVFWNQNKFHKVFELTETVDEDGGGVHNFEYLSFPSINNENAELITKTTNTLDFVETPNGGQDIYMIIKKDFYNWDGVEIKKADVKSESTTVNVEDLQMDGYIIDRYSFSSSSDSSIKFVASYASLFPDDRETEVDEYNIQIIATRQKVALHKINIKSNRPLSELTNIGKKGIKNVDDVISLLFSCGECGCTSSEIVVFWDGEKLRKVATLLSTSDVHTGDFSELIYPSETEGDPNAIIRHNSALNLITNDKNEDTDSLRYNSSKSFFKYDGVELVPTGQETISHTSVKKM